MPVELKHVDEKFLNKYFRKRSVFKTYKKYLTKSACIAIPLFVLFLAGSLAGLICAGYLLISAIVRGNTDVIIVGIIAFLFFLLLTAGCAFVLRLMTRNVRKPVEHFMELAAKNSGYSIDDIREFDRQAMESASLLVPTKAMLAITFRNGFLTRDYICFMGLANMLEVMKCQDVAKAMLYVSSAPITGTYKQIHNINIVLIAKNGNHITTPISEEIGNALQAILQERFPQIETNGGKVMTENEYCKWSDQVRAKNKP